MRFEPSTADEARRTEHGTRGALAVRSVAVVGVCLALLTAMTSGCHKPNGPSSQVCATDDDCSSGAVCRDAKCRKTCQKALWVGQQVRVSSRSGKSREGKIADCDSHVIWVKYVSGVEEGVEAQRIRPVVQAQERR